MPECPVCKKDIQEGAKKCMHCGSFVNSVRRGFEILLKGFQLISFVGVLLVLVFAYQSNRIANEGLKLTKQSITESLARTDSSLSLSRQQLAVMIEALDVQRDQAKTERQKKELAEKELKEKTKPRIIIKLTEIRIGEDKLTVYFDVTNEGGSAAEHVVALGQLTSVNSARDTSSYWWAFDKIHPTKTKVLPVAVRLDTTDTLTCYLHVRYNWAVFDSEPETEKKYFLCPYLVGEGKYRISELDKKDIPRYWK